MKIRLDKNKTKKIIKPFFLPAIVLILLFIILDVVVMPMYVQKSKVTKVPNIIGLSIEEAKSKLQNVGLKPKEADYRVDRRYKVGTVINQIPQPESEVKIGRGIYLTISSGEERVSVPNLRGKSIRDATFNLERHGLRIGQISYETSEDIFPNTIISQTPSAHSIVKNGSSVDIIVSLGSSSSSAPVPDLSMKTLTEAERILGSTGFQVGRISYEVDTRFLPNTILAQKPGAGEIAQLGQAIDIVVAQKEEKKNEDGD